MADEDTTAEMREGERKAISADVDAFLRGGGKIELLPGVGEGPPRERKRVRRRGVALRGSIRQEGR